MTKKCNPKRAADHGYTKEDWDSVDAPELTDEQLKRAKPFSEALPELAEKVCVGRPPSDNPKVPVSIRLDKDVVETFKKGGAGWQSRMNAALREAAHLHD